jgi:ACR3 family arsenite efflux pump ArsB
MVPILFPLAHFFAEYGIASVQALADVLSLLLAVPIAIYMVRKIKRTWKAYEAERLEAPTA